MEQEIWKLIPNFNGYEVSNLGQVRSFHKKGGGISNMPQRILKPSAHEYGYPGVILRLSNKSYHKWIHVLVMLAFVGPCPDGLEVCHNDDNPENSKHNNLRYDTHANNMKGKRSKYATKEQIIEMKRLYNNGVTIGDLSAIFKIPHRNVDKLIRSRNNGGSVIGHFPESRRRAKLIRIEFVQGTTPLELSIKYNLTRTSIYRIVKDKQC